MVPEAHGLGVVRGGRDPVLRAGRVHVLHHSGAVRGGVVVANIFLESGVGMNVANRDMLRDLACRVKEFSLPYVITGDFNMTKDELEVSEVLKWFDAECYAPPGPTRAQSGRAIDMFLVSHELIVSSVVVAEGSPVCPHKPVVLTLHPGYACTACQRSSPRSGWLGVGPPTTRRAGCASRTACASSWKRGSATTPR